ncbi:MAG: DUF5702 domain-containing protein [Clostridium sp.]|nr:DUF5702 domain-containing protein [Clostridium sp.]
MERKGEITVFLAMILVSVCALLCGLVESARTAGARCSLRMAANASMDSLMSQYHRKLWREYRILGLEYDGERSLEAEMEAFLEGCLKGGNWYPMKTENAKVREIAALTHGNGRYMEGEILEYMKYGLIETVWEALTEEEAGNLLTSWREGESVNRVSELYAGHTRDAVRLEKGLEAINDRLSAQKVSWEKGEDCLDKLDGSGFLSQAGNVIKELKKLPALVDAYEKRADKLNEKLQESRRKFEEEQDGLGETVRAALEDEIRQYESYVSQDGARRREIVNLKSLGAAGIQYAEGVIQDAEAVIEYIDNWEPESENDELDEEELWEPVKAKWKAYGILSLGIEFGVKDKEKEGLLERIGDLASGGLLELVLPEGTVLSGKMLELGAAPSASREKGGERLKEGLEESDTGSGSWGTGSGGGGIVKGVRSLLDRVIIGEYAIRFFQTFSKEIPGDSFYELEYILKGNKEDKANLAQAAAALTAVRQGLNLVHILSDSAKRQEARALAMAIVGATGFMPLVTVVSFFVMAVWALGEALLDVRELLDKGRVPIFKTQDQWNLGLEGLLNMGRNKSLGDKGLTGSGGKSGTDYKGYLRILLFTGYGADMIYRMMDVMQINIGRNQPEFSMAGCACMVDMQVQAGGKHVFFSTGLWKSQSGDGGLGYDINMEVSGSYLDRE